MAANSAIQRDLNSAESLGFPREKNSVHCSVHLKADHWDSLMESYLDSSLEMCLVHLMAILMGYC